MKGLRVIVARYACEECNSYVSDISDTKAGGIVERKKQQPEILAAAFALL
jgi:hypothetical protein